MKRDLSPDGGIIDDDDDDEEDEGPVPKRPRPSGGFSDTSLDGPSAELQLEAMLAANGGSAPGGGPPYGGKGPGKGAPGMGPPGAGGAGMPGGPGVGMAPPQVEESDGQPRVETTPMDFSRLSRDLPSRSVPVPKELVEHLMTPEHRQLLTEQSGADVEWAPEEAQVKVRGSAEQVKRATRLLQRVLMHCHWGKSEAKVKRLLKPRLVESAICRLSPMNTLRPAEKLLSNAQPLLSIGKDKGNDVVIQDPIISRQHCILELDPERGAIYAIDCSTNGTFLNGIRLPSKTVGKVLLSHGDELLFKDPSSGELEFGYILNITELHVKAEIKLEAPRRLLTPEEMANSGRDFA
mmetsp:Transcript_52045/g.161116  ORF Transcript_52045/g.161116 Transcript_52045/m.161116 type:complete len:350 (-) Transcript_52045:63-1112(-)